MYKNSINKTSSTNRDVTKYRVQSQLVLVTPFCRSGRFGTMVVLVTPFWRSGRFGDAVWRSGRFEAECFRYIINVHFILPLKE